MKEKNCSGCDDIKTISNFHKNKSKYDGLSSYCISCSKEYALQYKEQHKERLSQYNKERYKRICIEKIKRICIIKIF